MFTGPNGGYWFAFILTAILAILYLSGHGSSLLAGFNMKSKEEKAKYNVKKLCRIMGLGIAIISVMLLLIALGVKLPLFVYFIVVIADGIAMTILGRTACFKK